MIRARSMPIVTGRPRRPSPLNLRRQVSLRRAGNAQSSQTGNPKAIDYFCPIGVVAVEQKPANRFPVKVGPIP